VSFHKRNLGAFGEYLQADLRGHLPEREDKPWDLSWENNSKWSEADDSDHWWVPEWTEYQDSVQDAIRSLEGWQERSKGGRPYN